MYLSDEQDERERLSAQTSQTVRTVVSSPFRYIHIPCTIATPLTLYGHAPRKFPVIYWFLLKFRKLRENCTLSKLNLLSETRFWGSSHLHDISTFWGDKGIFELQHLHTILWEYSVWLRCVFTFVANKFLPKFPKSKLSTGWRVKCVPHKGDFFGR